MSIFQTSKAPKMPPITASFFLLEGVRFGDLSQAEKAEFI